MINRDLRDQLLNKHMTRKQFLQYMAGAVIVALGIKNFLNLFANYNQSILPETTKKPEAGFGSRKFGV